jgi:hypothetical protein
VHTLPPHGMRKKRNKRKKVPPLAFLIPGRFRLTQIALLRIGVAPFPEIRLTQIPLQTYQQHPHLYIDEGMAVCDAVYSGLH